MKLKKLYAATVLALGMPIAAQAGLTFDADGIGGDDPVDVGTFDWGPTSFLALDGAEAIDNFVDTGGLCVTASCSFDVITHANLIGTVDQAGDISTPTGLVNGDYEVTLIATFTENVIDFQVSTVTGFTTATFGIDDSVSMTLEIYADSTPDSDPLTGSGYNDGTLILFADTITESFGTFTVTSAETDFALDQTSGDADGIDDDYPGQDTVEGTGNQGSFEVDPVAQDFDYFKTQLAMFGLDWANISQQLPFISVDPSDCFTTSGNAASDGSNVGDNFATSGCDTTHVLGTYADQGASAAPGYTPRTSDLNGFPGPASEDFPDFVAQTDFNSPVQVVQRVPEPGTLALIGLGLGALGLRRRRRS